MDPAFRQLLLRDGVLSGEGAICEALNGGISSDIYRVEDGGRVFVVKRALSQLKVAAEWHADPARNRYEVAYLNRVREIVPKNVPEVFSHSDAGGYFTMEMLGSEFLNWKNLMMGGCFETSHAATAGKILGTIHRETWADAGARAHFTTSEGFHDLRLEPYLLATAEKHPEVRERMVAEADRIRDERQCLVHGDFSPKNLLFCGERMMILDCEVAWFGDAAFDVAFLLNHLVLKSLHLVAHRERGLEMVSGAWLAYQSEQNREDIEADLVRLLPMLMLARVDGKSPVEYLDSREQNLVREFAIESIRNPNKKINDWLPRWSRFLQTDSP
jgi:aminoglycoside phosphotransferase (APT) family kinase protein